jgi:SpoVK/Ycf46/Vps4 family AAA+-type ATPase
MTTSAQIKALLKSYKENDRDRFKSIAMQIAAHESQMGHEKLAEEIKEIVGKFEDGSGKVISFFAKPSIAPQGELSGLFESSHSKIKLVDLVLEDSLKKKLSRIVNEQNSYNKLRNAGLLPRSKVLLIGDPGTGKTMTASALAGELDLPIFTVQLDGLITKYMGETSSKLRLIFDHIKRVRGVYFFDEFDAIGGSRNLGNDVGEIRRILNTFLQFIENSRSDSLIIAATNHSDLLDRALFRRFDDVLMYDLPHDDLIIQTYKKYLISQKTEKINWKNLKEKSAKISYADIRRVCDNAIKHTVLENQKISESLIVSFIDEIKKH